MKFILLINVKMPTIVSILTFISRINTPSESSKARNTYLFQRFRFHEHRENYCGWRTSYPNTSLTQFQLDKPIPYGALNACGVGLVLSPSAHLGSGNHGDMMLIHHGKRHDAYAFILETLMLFSGVPRCGQLGSAALFKLPKPE